jgi:tetratricopeptide (TPR) repeat protein
MTATLTEADVQDHGVEITQFTAVPKNLKDAQAQKDSPAPEGIASASGQIEWLSDEFAQEFGDDFGATVSVQTDVSSIRNTPSGGTSKPVDQGKNLIPNQDEQPTQVTTAEEKAKQEMLKRATVKADTLPSEHKSFQGDRPKPIDALIRNPGKTSGSSALTQSHHTTVSVPVDPEPAPKMIRDDDETKRRERRGKNGLMAFAAVATVVVLGLGSYFFLPRNFGGSGKESNRKVRAAAEAFKEVREAIILFDLDGAKSALADLEIEPSSRGEASTYLAQAVVKKEFLFDVEGAMLALQTARGQARNKRTESEVDNLIAVYGFDRDSASSADMLRRNVEANKEDPVYRYNLALGLIRTGRPQEAIPLLEGLPGSGGDNTLIEDAALAQGWAIELMCSSGSREAACRRGDAESAYARALEVNPNSAKARLGLALYRFRHGGIKASEGDFRTFLDALPELDPPNRVINYRKLGNSDFYAFAHSQIIDLNTPNQNMSKPSPLIMAADAIISSILNRTSEAGKILETALSSAPGDVNVLKAMGYLKWKNGQLNELVDSFKDVRERNSFAINLLLGKANLKLRKRDLAERYFHNLVESHPNRAEGHSLLGDLLLEQPERVDEARSEFKLALRRDSLDLLAWRGLKKLDPSVQLSPELQKSLPF